MRTAQAVLGDRCRRDRESKLRVGREPSSIQSRVVPAKLGLWVRIRGRSGDQHHLQLKRRKASQQLGQLLHQQVAVGIINLMKEPQATPRPAEGPLQSPKRFANRAAQKGADRSSS